MRRFAFLLFLCSLAAGKRGQAPRPCSVSDGGTREGGRRGGLGLAPKPRWPEGEKARYG